MLPGIIEDMETAPLHRHASLQGADDLWFWVGREHQSAPTEYPTDSAAHPASPFDSGLQNLSLCLPRKHSKGFLSFFGKESFY